MTGPMPGFAAAAPAFPSAVPAAAAAGALAGVAVATGAHALVGQTQGPISAPRICSKCGHSGGNRKFCIQCGNFLGAPSATAPQAQLETSAVLVNQTGPRTPVEQYGYGSTAYQTGPRPQADSQQAAAYPYQQQSVTGAPQAYVQAPAPNAPPFPGSSPEAQSNTAPRRAPLFDGPLQIAEAAQQSYTSKRQPLTSMNPDVSRLGFPPGTINPADPGAVPPGPGPQPQ